MAGNISYRVEVKDGIALRINNQQLNDDPSRENIGSDQVLNILKLYTTPGLYIDKGFFENNSQAF